MSRKELAREAYELGDRLTSRHLSSIRQISIELEIDERYIRRQLLLHCPNYPIEQVSSDDFLTRGKDCYNVLYRRCLDHKMAARKYEPEISINKGFRFLNEAGAINDTVRTGPVVLQQARLIESQLHYMQNFRATSTRRLGLYHDQDAWPFCYTSVATCDRNYMHEAVESALGDAIEIKKVAVLSRLYASTKAPKNSISFLIAKVMKLLKLEGFDLFVTASNPFLGFSASSLAGANYVPFAQSPVAYNYDNMGLYRTRRSGHELDVAKWIPPSNFLFMKSLVKPLSARVRSMPSIMKIDREKHSDVDTSAESSPLNIERSVREVRLSLEGVWGDETRYHRTKYNPKSDPVSKGQCGVTSVYLARHLEAQGHKVFFCEGDAYFEGYDPIEQHCWLVLPKEASANRSTEDIVIDITADQSGYESAVVCETTDELAKRGIRYIERSRTLPSQVGVEHVRARLKVLQGGLRSRNTRREK